MTTQAIVIGDFGYPMMPDHSDLPPGGVAGRVAAARMIALLPTKTRL